MALKTEDDYQDEIDDLKKEIDRLYDEGTDKGFKLKREEEMEQEQRALETEKDYQREYDAIYKEAETISKKLESEALELLDKYNAAHRELKEVQNKYVDLKKKYAVAENKLEESDQKYIKKLDKLVEEAKKKGFKIKEGVIDRNLPTEFETRKNLIIADLTDLEARKNEVLQSLEARALETQEDYQSEIKYYKEDISFYENYIKEHQSNVEKYEVYIDKHKPNIEKYEKLIKEAKDAIEKLYKAGTKKGFKLKRGADLDFETRAMDNQKAYQQEINDWAEQVEDRIEKYKRDLESAEYWKEEAQKDYKSMLDVYDEGTKKGFKLKVKKFKI